MRTVIARMLGVWIAAIASSAAAVPPNPDQNFIDKLTGARVIGTFLVTKGQRPDEFQELLAGIQSGMSLRITSVERLEAGNPADWRFGADLQTPVGLVTLSRVCPVTFSTNGNSTQTIHVNTFFVPGCGNIGGEVFFTGRRFTGTWCTGNHSGTMEGNATPTTSDNEGQGPNASYWQSSGNEQLWAGYRASDDFETVFGVSPGGKLTLAAALRNPSGDAGSLLSQSVAALLNASSPEVDYGYSVEEVIQLVQDAFATGDFQAAEMMFESQNATDAPAE